MHFVRPFFVYIAFLSIPALIIFYYFALKQRKKDISGFGNAALLQKLMDNFSARIYKTKIVLVIIGCFFILIALAGPQIGARMVEVERSGIDILIAIDTSYSMKAEDIKPDRLARAKQELFSFINHVKGDRVGVIIFAGTAFLQCPLTLDYNAAKMFLDIIDTDLIQVQGTAIGDAVRLAAKSFSKKERKHKALILLTDGEDHDSDPSGAANEAKKEGIRIYTIGFGSTSGEPIPMRNDGKSVSGYKKDRKGEVVMSKLDELTLQKIALETGGKYYRSTTGEIEVERIYDDISSMEKKTLQSKMYSQYEDRYQYFLFVGLLCLILEFILSGRRISMKIKKFTAAMFTMLFVMSFSSSSHASIAGKVRQGNKLYNKKNYDEALAKYRDAQIDSPEMPELHFNSGDALYKKDSYEESVKEFEKSTYSKDINLQAKAYYNIGNSLYKSGKLEDSILYYKKALEINPGDEDAKYNIEFVQKKIKEMMDKNKQQGKQDQKQNKDQQNKQDKQNQDQQQNKNDKKQNNKEQEQKQQAEKGQNKKDQAEPKKGAMSKEEAQALLNAIKEENKNLQKKRVSVPRMGSQEKDW